SIESRVSAACRRPRRRARRLDDGALAWTTRAQPRRRAARRTARRNRDGGASGGVVVRRHRTRAIGGLVVRRSTARSVGVRRARAGGFERAAGPRRPGSSDRRPTLMAPRGELALVLHAHLPWVRHPEHATFLEEGWLFEAITETYVPLLDVLGRLADDGVPHRLTLSF